MIKLNSAAEPKYIKSSKLERMQKELGGSVQLLAIGKDMHVYCNEEGMLLDLTTSTFIPDFLNYMGFKLPVLVFGDVLITGIDKSLTTEQVDSINKQYAIWRSKIKK